MEEEQPTMTNQKTFKKLNLNIPLLSVRRHAGSSWHHFESSSIISRRGLSRPETNSSRVPFSWEQVPGKPKPAAGCGRCELCSDADHVPPRPKPPPGRRHHHDHPDAASGSVLNKLEHPDQAGGCCSLRDPSCCSISNSNNIDAVGDGSVTEVVDTLSLSEAIDILEKSDTLHQLDASKLKMVEAAGSLSPSFMINRFLPDANALAAEYESSFQSRNDLHADCSLMMSKEDAVIDHIIRDSPSRPSSHKSKAYSRFLTSHQQPNNPATTTTMKVCGLENIFSWRMKHRQLCGVNKSPVLRPP